MKRRQKEKLMTSLVTKIVGRAIDPFSNNSATTPERKFFTRNQLRVRRVAAEAYEMFTREGASYGRKNTKRR